jgi:hypothetical protein
MKRMLSLLLFTVATTILAQTSAAPAEDSWKSISFLEGTWIATAQGAGGVAASGRYTFAPELGHHIMARHSTSDPNCKGPATFDCEHSDLLYIFQDAPSQPLKAIYFDNEGHVIHYTVSTPDAMTAIFLSDPGPGPRFRLVYRLSGAVMSGKFQMQMPGQENWKSYLEWSGGKG